MTEAPDPRAPGAARITTRRPMGIETELGVAHAEHAARGDVGAGSAIMLSHLVVGAYALLAPEEGPRGRRVRWDYGDESPLRDARGFEIQRAAAHPTQLTDQVRDAHVPSIDLDVPLAAAEVAPGGDDAEVLDWALRRSLGNAVLRNGARWYVDHAHPEYSSAEVMTAREGVLVDRAGEVIAQRTMEILAAAEGVPEVALYKNNTDGKGASYGTHENYLLDRSVPFEHVVRALIPFFASRAILVGAGRVGIGTRGQEDGFQISSRADFFEAEVGLETTLNRPIVNTRDEPHADASRFRRLHVIIGDANLLETPTYLKLGMTSLVLAALELEHAQERQILPRIPLADPVGAVHAISHDLDLRVALPLVDGGSITALEIQRAYHRAVGAVLDVADPESRDVHAQWGELLDLLEHDPAAAADRIEWVAKLQLLEGFRARHGLGWGDPKLRMIDLQFSDLRPARSLYAKLRGSGRVRTLVTEQEAREAAVTPPESTRAHLRGRLIREHPGHVTSAGWDVITLAGEAGAGLTLRCADPRIGSRAWLAEHGIDPADEVEAVLAALRELAASTSS
ncbi:depupylase/deamidase Dop [Brachybacterium hainanense]|uniref:Depupylase/deamidase Dop n=1 Tax=Brachybacterium hainanense TaxID=1541174 RepID=A0ABV6RBB1_9MICO